MRKFEKYLKAEEDRKKGVYDGIPWFMEFSRMGEVIPTIDRGREIMLLAGSGVGKSLSFIGLVLLPVYNLIKSINYKAKFYIHLLEDTAELFEDRVFSYILAVKTGIYLSPLELWSKKKNYVSDDIKAVYPEVQDVVDDVLSHCIIVDNIFHATGIYKYLRTESEKYGEHHYEVRDFEYKNEDGSKYTEKTRVYSNYEVKDSTHIIVCIDNLNNMAEEKGGTIRDSMNKWCRDYARLQITKHWNWTVWNICQTALETDRQQFDNRGRQVVEKLEPNLSSLGDSKIISRDHHLILSLFSPNRFGIGEYEGYNINRIKDKFRTLIVLKSNFSQANVKIPFYFNGAVGMFKELPLPDNLTEEQYQAIEQNKVKPKQIKL